MKFESTAEKIKKAVMLAERITGKQVTLPVLESILVTVSNKKIIIRPTNLSLGLEISFPAKTDGEGVFAVPGSVFSQFLNSLQEGVLQFEFINGNLSIITKLSKTIIKCVPHDDFPTLPKIDGGEEVRIPSEKFIDGIKSVLFASAVSDIKPEISSVYIYPEDDFLIFVSTDSFRLAEKKIKMRSPRDFSGIIIPFKNCLEISRVFGDYNGELILTLAKNQITIEGDGIYLGSRVIDAVFPDYKQIIPTTFSTKIATEQQAFINALRTAGVFSQGNKSVRLEYSSDKQTIPLITQSQELGQSVVDLPSSVEGKSGAVILNYHYVLDCLLSVGSSAVTIKIIDDSSPSLIFPEGDDSYIYLVMPIKN